ncbi:MAG TPA: SGNH/GDSL hydrolase family protein [Chitinophagaceae bacterium]|nr:SGNH/GDSL hydrolase family protein [Chitinophagaceae bacterium]
MGIAAPIFAFLFLAFGQCRFAVGNENQLQYLALGDSYTIGESVPVAANFPNQAARLLRAEGLPFADPRIVAKTGWTTDELRSAIEEAATHDPFLTKYELVTLLIGVNDQYRGRPVSEYEGEFRELLQRSIQFAGGDKGHVIVLSIPDWGVTPFAEGRDRQRIANEIDEYNRANAVISSEMDVHYLSITHWTREAGNEQSLLAADGLHPSGKEYARWAGKITGLVVSMYRPAR